MENESLIKRFKDNRQLNYLLDGKNSDDELNIDTAITDIIRTLEEKLLS